MSFPRNKPNTCSRPGRRSRIITFDIYRGKSGGTKLATVSRDSSATPSRSRKGDTYEAKEIAEVVPPEVSLSKDTGDEAKDHSDNSQADEDGIYGDETVIPLGFIAAHEFGDIFGA